MFPPKPNGNGVPLVGQPFGIGAWTLQLVVECKCRADGQGTAVLLALQEDHMGRRTSGVVCPACGHTVFLQRLYTNAQGQMFFEVNKSAERATAAPARPEPPAPAPS